MKKKTRLPFSDLPRKIGKKAGLPPGSLIYTGNRTGTFSFELLTYNEYEVKSIKKIEGPLKEMISDDHVNWFNVIGLHDTESIDNIGSQLDIHPLMLEDILNINHPPKIELTDDHMFITLKILHEQGGKKQFYQSDHCSIILGKNYVISFLEQDTKLFDDITLFISLLFVHCLFHFLARFKRQIFFCRQLYGLIGFQVSADLRLTR